MTLTDPLPDIPDAGLTSPGEMMPMFYLFRAVPEMFSGVLQASPGNTATMSVGMGGIAAIRDRRRLVLAPKVFALSIEAMSAPLEHFDAALKPLFGDRFEAAAIDIINHWLNGVPQDNRRPYQAPVIYRILPRMLGHCGRSVCELKAVVETSLRSMMSNPTCRRAKAAASAARTMSQARRRWPTANISRPLFALKHRWPCLPSAPAKPYGRQTNGRPSPCAAFWNWFANTCRRS